MDNETGFQQDIDNISNMSTSNIGPGAPMQLANVFRPKGNGVAHLASFTSRAPGLTSLKAKDAPTLSLKLVVKDNDLTLGNTAFAFPMHLKGSNSNRQDGHSRITTDSDSDIIKVEHATLAPFSYAADICNTPTPSVCVDATGIPAYPTSKPLQTSTVH